VGASGAGTKFWSDRCRYRHRDRVKYGADPQGERAKSRRYYAANRDAVIARGHCPEARGGETLGRL